MEKQESAIEWLENNLIFDPWAEEHFKHNEECWEKAKSMQHDQFEKLKDFEYWKEWKNL